MSASCQNRTILLSPEAEDTGTKKGLGSCAELYGGSNSRLCPAPSPGDLQGMVPQAAYQFAIGLAISDPCFVIACPNEASR